jgi:hypothetical protein
MKLKCIVDNEYLSINKKYEILGQVENYVFIKNDLNNIMIADIGYFEGDNMEFDYKFTVNGKDFPIELTKEQQENIKNEINRINNKTEFDRVEDGESYYYITSAGKVGNDRDKVKEEIHSNRFSIGNYCIDKELLEKRAKEEILHRLLWRYSMEHIESPNFIYYICHAYSSKEWIVGCDYLHNSIFTEHFSSMKVALNAIRDVIKPFEEKYEYIYE